MKTSFTKFFPETGAYLFAAGHDVIRAYASSRVSSNICSDIFSPTNAFIYASTSRASGSSHPLAYSWEQFGLSQRVEGLRVIQMKTELGNTFKRILVNNLKTSSEEELSMAPLKLVYQTKA